MDVVPAEDGLRVVEEDVDLDAPPDEGVFDGDETGGGTADGELESLRDAFVEAFNARDVDEVLALVAEDVECPDFAGDGADVLAAELQAIWERSTSALLTRAFLDGTPCAVAWMPDDEGCWTRRALVCLDAEDALLTVVALPDDTDALERADAEDPSGDEVEEWSDWAEWDRGEETVPRAPDRTKP